MSSLFTLPAGLQQQVNAGVAVNPTVAVQVAIIRSVGGVVFDATFEERHTATLEVTENPVETGVTVSDHAYMKPLRLTVSAGVSDTQLSVRQNDPFLGGSRSRAAYELLRELQASAEPFDVQTGLVLYQNMVCSEIRTTQDKGTSAVLMFEADFREVIIVDTQVVAYTPRRAASVPARKNKGEQQGKQVTDPARASSLVDQLGKAFGLIK